MARPGFFGRQYFIQKKFQGKFILLYTLSVAMIVGMASWILYRQINLAVEKHLYRTHIRIEKVGDFLFDLLFAANFYTILTLMVIVLILSLFIFIRINRTFSGLEDRLSRMAECDFSENHEPQFKLVEIGQLNELIETLRITNRKRVGEINQALIMIEQALEAQDRQQLLTGKELLDNLLKKIKLL